MTIIVHSAIYTPNEELCTIIVTPYGVYNLVLLQGNMNNFLSGVPLKFEIFYSVGTHAP